MDSEDTRKLLAQVKRGSLSVDAAVKRLRHLPYEALGFAAIDHHRTLRQGHSEVIFCEGKRPEQVLAIIRRMVAVDSPVLATRATPQLFQAVKRIDPRAVYHDSARTITIQNRSRSNRSRRPGAAGGILIITAGTADIPVAEEAKVTLAFLGHRVETIYDVGVAGLHRLWDHRSRIEAAGILIIVAGMDGALPSVIGGWMDKPIVAVPTSIGYGASFGGVAALLTMLNTCAAGVAVVNIDNGFGAAVLAHRMMKIGQALR
ncbi:MAG: nickel pincer cofactor biosynthesis protein LarB [Nitrospirae bacterium]|nr:nickel pincer cofactor biosynthesis protein LarB [Nitrospirota bacterium]